MTGRPIVTLVKLEIRIWHVDWRWMTRSRQIPTSGNIRALSSGRGDGHTNKAASRMTPFLLLFLELAGRQTTPIEDQNWLREFGEHDYFSNFGLFSWNWLWLASLGWFERVRPCFTRNDEDDVRQRRFWKLRPEANEGRNIGNEMTNSYVTNRKTLTFTKFTFWFSILLTQSSLTDSLVIA